MQTGIAEEMGIEIAGSHRQCAVDERGLIRPDDRVRQSEIDAPDPQSKRCRKDQRQRDCLPVVELVPERVTAHDARAAAMI